MQLNRLLPLLLVLSLLAGCVPSAPTIRYQQAEPPSALANNPAFSQAIMLEKTGNYAQAAALFEQLAMEAKPPVQQEALLRAAEDYLQAGDVEAAYNLLPRIGTSNNSSLDFKKRVLFAEVAIKQNQPEEALQLLTQRPRGETSADLMRRYHHARANAFQLTGNQLESGRAQAELDLLLLDPNQRLENQKEIIQTLSTMTDNALRMLRPSPPGIFGGWMELTRIIKVYPDDPQMGQQRLERWRENFSSHPAMPELLEGYFQRINTMYRAPNHVAVLLPKSGPYAKPAEAIRQGLMAAYYNQRGGNRPQLKFYDSSDSYGIWPLYQQAVSAGAELVIGPLSKDAVAQLARAGALSTPVLALNQVAPDTYASRGFYQFALAPEDEARQVAERAWVDGHTSALVLAPEGDWGERVVEAFSRRWEQLGGTILEQQNYNPKEHDFSKPIQELLNIGDSKKRHKALERLLGSKLEFEPRRRQDANFIFLAAKWQQARQLRPQLQFHHAAKLPVYSTSHAYRGIEDPVANLDLEGVRFPDAPWLIVSGEQESSLAKMLPKHLAAYGRLFAMGIDAYRILPHLPRLEADSRETLDGKTGILYLDGIKHIHRQLVWAEMRKGKPKVIGYAPRMEERQSTYSSPFSSGGSSSSSSSPFPMFGR